MLYQPWGCYKRRSFFVYTMSQVQICACTRIYIWRMYIIELLSEMLYGVYRSSRSQPARLYDEPSADLCLHKDLHLANVHHRAVK